MKIVIVDRKTGRRLRLKDSVREALIGIGGAFLFYVMMCAILIMGW